MSSINAPAMRYGYGGPFDPSVKIGGMDDPCEVHVVLNTDFSSYKEEDVLHLSPDYINSPENKKVVEPGKGVPQLPPLETFLKRLQNRRETIEKNSDLSTDQNIREMSREELDRYLYSKAFNQNDRYSELLLDGGFFDNLSDETATDVFLILEKITHGTSYFTNSVGSSFSLDPTDSYSSSEFAMESISSAAALHSFADKLLTGKLKDDFRFLAAEYMEFNLATAESYKSYQEIMQEKMAENPYDMSEAARAGRVEDVVKKIRKNSDDLRFLFDKIQNKDDVGDAMKQIISQFMDIVSGGSKYEPLRDYVGSNAQGAFDHMEDYWAQLSEFQIKQ